MTRRGAWTVGAAFGALVLLAATGQAVLVRAGMSVYAHAGLPTERALVAGDFVPLLHAAQAFIHGQPARPWYGGETGLVYAPQYAILLGPFGLLPASAALGAARVTALGFQAVALFLWVAASRQRRVLTMVLLLTSPAIEVVMNGQVMASGGLLALTLAIWAQRRERWVWAGVALGFGFIRISNALPLATMLVVVASARPRRLIALSGGAALVLGPLTLAAFLWDEGWIADFLFNIHQFRLSGPLRLVQIAYGTTGVALVTAANCAICGWIARRDRGGPIDLDRGAAVLALTVLTATLAGIYTAVFALPALVRVAARPGARYLLWAVAVIPWLLVLALSPWLLGADPQTTLNYIDTVGPLVLVAAAYPLL
ncbi:MAG: hypothetical protein QOK05_372, partial [Chloroflexota bacterium]|nr:hypothetical protein [Chloroflexota bacterium]